MRNFWCEINIDSIEHNIKKIRSATDKKIMAVLKANAYGLGIEDMSAILDEYVDAFGVSNMEEALKVRSSKDILILYPVLGDDDIEKIRDNFIISVDSREMLNKLYTAGKEYRVHIYVDTGMNRFGVKPHEVEEFIGEIKTRYTNIKIEGIYTHLHNTGDSKYTINQIETFRNIVEKYRDEIKYIHLLNTNGFLMYNDRADFDNMIRVGNLIYGYNSREFGYKKVFSYKAIPVRVYTLAKDEYIGYGNSYRAKKDMRVGILDVGFIDKLGCALESKRNIFHDIAKAIYHHLKYNSGITCRGKMVRVLGKPNMNFTLVDMEELNRDEIFAIDLPSVIADSSILKKYRKGDSYVSV